MKTVFQFITPARDEHEAQALKAGYLMQDCCLGVRVLPPKYRRGLSVQAFTEDSPEMPDSEVFAIGACRVLLPASLEALLEKRGGIAEAA